MSAFLSNFWSWDESLQSLIDFIIGGGKYPDTEDGSEN